MKNLSLSKIAIMIKNSTKYLTDCQSEAYFQKYCHNFPLLITFYLLTIRD